MTEELNTSDEGLIMIRIEAIEFYMKRAGIPSHVDLAERIGITQANLNKITRNRWKALRRDTFTSLCRALKCKPGDILELSE